MNISKHVVQPETLSLLFPTPQTTTLYTTANTNSASVNIKVCFMFLFRGKTLNKNLKIVEVVNQFSHSDILYIPIQSQGKFNSQLS